MTIMRNILHKFAILLFMLGITAAEAATWRFRSGEILAAELTTSSVMIRELDPAAFPNLPQKRLYAVLSVRPDSGRPISIFDYSLDDGKAVYPCVALNSGTGFVYTDRNITGSRIVQLLFVLDAQSPPGDNIVLKCNLPPANGIYDLRVSFRDLGSAYPTSLSALPENGSMPGPRNK